MTSAERIKHFLDEDLDRVDDLLEKYPINIPVAAVAEFLHISGDSVRSAIECGAFGIVWRKTGKVNKAYSVPTAQFVRWYLNVNVLKIYNMNYDRR